MHYLWNAIILPLMKCIQARTVVEIGTGDGKNTINILEYAKSIGGTVHSIDTKRPKAIDFLEQDYPQQLVFHQEQSLKVLGAIAPCDAVLIDGDHNWYTVYHELQAIYAKAHGSENFPLVFIHDISWPYARRDLYYDPSTIPAVYQHPYEKGGISLDKDALSEIGLNANLYHSVQENIPRCGVLTAVEDFLAAHQGEFAFYNIPGIYGLGVVVSRSALERNDTLRNTLNEYVLNPSVSNLIHTVEDCRITAVMLRQKYEKMSSRLHDRCTELERAIQAMQAKQDEVKDAKQLEEELDNNAKKLEEARRRMQQAQKANAELLQLTQSIQKKTQDALKEKQQEHAETVKSMQQKLDDMQTELTKLQDDNKQLSQSNADLAASLKYIQNTRSWRWTGYLRNAIGFIRSLPKKRATYLRPGTVLHRQQDSNVTAPISTAALKAYQRIDTIAEPQEGKTDAPLTNTPLLSYVLYVERNDEQTLRRSLNTLVQQSYTRWELHIWHPKHNTLVPSVVAMYQRRYPGAIHCHATQNNTVSLGTVFSETNGELLFYVHDNWLLRRSALETMVRAYNQGNSQYNAYIAPYMTADLTGIPTQLHTANVTKFNWRKQVRVCLFPRSVLRELSDSNPTLPFTKPALLLRAISSTPKTVYVHNKAICTELH